MSDDDLRENIRAIAAAGVTVEEGAGNLRHNAALIATAMQSDELPEWVREQEGT